MGKLLAACALGAVALLCDAAMAQHVTVLDLTEPAHYPPSPRGYPVMGGGGVSGMKIGPDPYPIPLQVTISKVEPETIARRDTFILEIEMKNRGRAPFFFPVSRDIARVELDGNRGRRVARLFIHFEKPSQPKLAIRGVALLAGSPSIPGSLRRLNPGDSVVLRVRGDLEGVSELMPDDQSEVSFRAGYSERTLKDEQFAVENMSEQVTSSNTFTLAVRSQ